MFKKEDELEFISVGYDEENMTATHSTYVEADSEGPQSIIGSWLANYSKHPVTVIFHFLFKALALFLYIFGGLFTSNYILIFVLCIIFLACDFWTVKNISGRLLVGLRWWSYTKEDGSSDFVFESLEDTAELSPFEIRLFWGGLYVPPIIWSLLLVLGILRLKFQFIPVVVAALFMSVANIVGYTKCSASAGEKVKSYVDQGLRSGALAALENSSFRGWIMDTVIGGAKGRGNAGGPINV